MNADDTLVIDRSVLSFADCHNGHWIRDLFEVQGAGSKEQVASKDQSSTHTPCSLLLTPCPHRIIVGTGPGSFAGIRSAIAFATGYQLGHPETEVLGLTSAAALAAPGEKRAVVGDARQGHYWVALFDGYNLLEPVFQVADLAALSTRHQAPGTFSVISPDDARIGEKLRAAFGARYLGLGTITNAKLAAAAAANPALLAPEPRPIYLNPAVRT